VRPREARPCIISAAVFIHARPSVEIASNDGAICQHDQLMPERGIFCFSDAAKFERRKISATIAAEVKRFCHQILVSNTASYR
jgi:hypothetical protein